MRKKITSNSAQTLNRRSVKEDGGLLMPILYALLAAVGMFTLVMLIAIGLTVANGPPQTATFPSAHPSVQGTLPSATPSQTLAPMQGWTGESGSPDAEPSQPPAEQNAAEDQISEPAPTSAPQTIRGLSSDTTVYVSQSGKIHSISNCSGMKYYTRKTLGEADVTARRGFYSYCSNCW